MKDFPPGLLQKIEYSNQYQPGEWTLLEEIFDTKDNRVSSHIYLILFDYFLFMFFLYLNIKGSNETITMQQNQYFQNSFTVPISGLKYSWTEYQVKVAMVSQRANLSDTRLWSDAAIVSGQTMSQVPGHSPVTCQASFMINRYPQTRDIFVYWQKIDQRFHNGPNFHYEITNITSDGQSYPISPDEVTESFAKFSRLSYDQSFEFSVISVNDEGSSPEASLVTVPEQQLINSLAPRSVTTIYNEDTNSFNISWFAPLNESQVVSYTIFWCPRKSIIDTQCSGKLEFIHVDPDELLTLDDLTSVATQLNSEPDTKIYPLNLTTDMNYILSVAANSDQGSSGMERSTCTIIDNSLRDGWVRELLTERVGDTWTQVRWSMPCSDRSGLVLGYLVTWCTRVAGQDKCHQSHATHSAEFSMLHNITGLQAWSDYTANVTAITVDGEGEPSGILKIKTLPSAPGSSPTTLKLTSVTNMSAAFSWDKPIRANGPISHYKVGCIYS